MNQARFEAFSEGVFAFAFTLLVLSFTLPALERANDATLLASLLRLWPNVIAYALSAGVVGIMWHNHQALFRLVERVDRTTIFVNLLLLAGTAFIPFATQALGTYPTLRPSTFLYGLTLTYCSTAYNLMLAHLVRSKAFRTGVTGADVRATVRAYRVGWLTYAIATLAALVVPLLSFALYIALTLYYLIPRGLDRDVA